MANPNPVSQSKYKLALSLAQLSPSLLDLHIKRSKARATDKKLYPNLSQHIKGQIKS